MKQKLQSRFAAIRVRPAHRDYWRSQPHPEEWLLMEWPAGESEPTKYWLSTLSADIALLQLVHLAKHRWIIERDYQELKQELGLGHYEGRGWRGFHHHATLCIAAYGFLVAERSRFPPRPVSAILDFQRPSSRQTSGRVVRRIRPERHNPRSITTLRMVLAHLLIGGIAQCPFCGSRSRLILSIDIRIYHTWPAGNGLARSSTNRSTVPLASVSRKRCNANSLVNLLAPDRFRSPRHIDNRAREVGPSDCGPTGVGKTGGSAPCKWR